MPWGKVWRGRYQKLRDMEYALIAKHIWAVAKGEKIICKWFEYIAIIENKCNCRLCASLGCLLWLKENLHARGQN